MNKNELSNWLIDKMKSCYPAHDLISPNNLYYFYDERHIRKLKLCKINNNKYKYKFINKVKGKCLFTKNYKTNVLYFNYDDIWRFFEKDYIYDYGKIQTLICNILTENSNLNLKINQISFSWLLPYAGVEKLTIYKSNLMQPIQFKDKIIKHE